jgi:NAD(P)-dependent dehydrogenase (short-subunit alcohol dehydrogenase family)
MELDGKVAIVTGAGGAGVGGLGVVFARSLAEAGATVVVSDVDGDAAEAVAANLRSAGHQALGVRADVAVDEEVEQMAAASIAAFGGIDILVNNAGLARGKWDLGLELPTEDWKTIFAVNSLGPLLCARACRKSMASRGGGAIVNLASMAAYGPGGAYSVTKLAVVGMTRTLAVELASDNIRVNAIAPGVMTGKLPPERVARALERQLISRRGTPEDLVGPLLFLCSAASSFMTGQTLLVDAGSIQGRI